jgi:tetratricopeptide (TPR) repeat protein
MAAHVSAAEEAAAATLDGMLDGVEEWTDEEHQRYIDSLGDAEEHPLFKSMSPDESDKMGKAMRAADVEDDEEAIRLSEAKKARGNKAFGKGSDFFGNALRHYKDALELLATVEDDSSFVEARKALASMLHSNIAAVYMKRKVWDRALGAAEEALAQNPANAKALYRKAKCCASKGRFEQGRDACRAAMETKTGASDSAVRALLAECEAGVSRRARRVAAREAAKAARIAQIEAARAVCAARGMKVGRALLRDQARTSRALPVVAADGVVSWPVTVLFPDRGVSELVEAYPETGSLADLLRMMLPSGEGKGAGGGYAPWDTERTHTVDAVSVFYRANEVRPRPLEQAWRGLVPGSETEGYLLVEGEEEEEGGHRGAAGAAKEFIRVPSVAPLVIVLLQPDCVLPGTVVLHVVPTGSRAEEELRRANGGAAFKQLRVPDAAAMR